MPCPEKFAESLVRFNVEQDIIDEIFDGYTNIVSKTPKKKKAVFFKRAIDILDEKVDNNTVRSLLEWNACCKTGARAKASKEFARINANLTLEEKLNKIRKAGYMNMGEPWFVGDDTIRINAVSYLYNGQYECGCSNFRRLKRDYPVSRSYCYCCGGHFKYHYEIMLDVKLELQDVVSSPLDSEGKNPCVFTYKIIR